MRGINPDSVGYGPTMLLSLAITALLSIPADAEVPFSQSLEPVIGDHVSVDRAAEQDPITFEIAYTAATVDSANLESSECWALADMIDEVVGDDNIDDDCLTTLGNQVVCARHSGSGFPILLIEDGAGGETAVTVDEDQTIEITSWLREASDPP